jgi:outer membrane protein TolC
MTKNLKILGNCLWLFVASFQWVNAQNDSINQLAFEDFMVLVKQHHPLAKQANLQEGIGQAYFQSYRGAFDPKIGLSLNQKEFDDKQYYSVLDAALKIPTWLGLDVVAGFEQNRGEFLNPEKNTPFNGLWFAGVSVPIGQGLFFDQRRAQFNQAKLFREMSKAEQVLMLNDLFYDAASAYWEWFSAFHVFEVYENSVALADERLQAIKMSVVLGDRPTIDTVEASIFKQNMEINLQQADLDYKNASAWLAVYLWADGLIPMELADNTQPTAFNETNALPFDNAFLTQFDSLLKNQPEIKQYELKLEQLDLERRLRAEQMKPILNLKYNALTETLNNDIENMYSPNNYRWGLEFGMPLFLRKERGNLKLAKLKLQDARFDFQNKVQWVDFKLKSSANEWQTSETQFSLFTRTVVDYEQMLNGERRMFDAGESSLFMVNTREQAYIQSKVKLIELLSKNRKSAVGFFYSAGLLGQ